MEVLEKLLGEIDNDVEARLSEESLEESFKNVEDMHLKLLADDELSVWISCLGMGANDNF